jgi:predicted ATPase/DNA-binding CsgD family transcriptional regulator
MTTKSLSYSGALSVPNNLPFELTSFIGREQEIEEVSRLLETARLLTVTGTGGCGKTRLALRVAAAAGDAYPDGIWLVELAPVADPAMVPQTVAFTIGMREAPGSSVPDSLADYLRAKTVLLVLDNCEHVVGAAARLAESLLHACPNVRILATSRETLGSEGERIWRVPSMVVPSSSFHVSGSAVARGTWNEELGTSDAVRLFVDRALAVQPGFMVTDRNAPALVEICRRLDGIPLAIELAAARVKIFSVEQIAARLDDRFRLLTSGQRTAMPRQQTLLATVEWSYTLLSEPERVLLRRLSVFAGGWTFEGAEAVGAGDGIQAHAVLDLLGQLVDKSLVIAEEQGGAVRYRLLETIRQYARDKLAEAGEVERTRSRHLDYFREMSEEADIKLRGFDGPAVLARLEAEHDNLRAALEWSLTRSSGEAALRLSGALARFWFLRGYHSEGLQWLMRALAARPERTAARMKALHGAGYLLQHRHDATVARALLEESLDIAGELGDQRTAAWVLYVLGRVAYYDNDPATARRLGRESLALAESTGDRGLIAWAIHLLGLAAHIAADYPTARTHYEHSLAIRRDVGDIEGIVSLQGLLSIIAVRERDLIEAIDLSREMLTTQRDLGGLWSFSMTMALFAGLAAMLGQPIRAVRLAAASAVLSEPAGTPRIVLMEAFLDDALKVARRSLNEDAFATAWAEGRAMTLEDSLAEALAVEVAPQEVPPRVRVPAEVRSFAALSPSELQVLRRLAGGYTTKEIAAELVVAVSTVDRHITHIYDKLGVRNRAAATAFALKHGLAEGE